MTTNSEQWNRESHFTTKTVDIAARDFRALIPTIFQACDFPHCDIQDATWTASATRTSQETGRFSQTSGINAFVRWAPGPSPESTKVEWLVYQFLNEQRTHKPVLQHKLGQAILLEVGRRQVSAANETLERDPVAWPGRPFEQPYEGTLKDYSGLADLGEAQKGLEGGVFPIGRYQFTPGDPTATPANAVPLTLNRFANGSLIAYNGVLVCAPQNSGKTTLITRWAVAATSSPQPYGLFIVDVKGNMREKLLNEGLGGTIYNFSTDPRDAGADRINFLAGPRGDSPADSDRIRQIATALLPSRGVLETGGDAARHYQNSVAWLAAFIHVLKLAKMFLPAHFTDPDDNPRDVDLCDLYEFVTDETKLCEWINFIVGAEDDIRSREKTPPWPGIKHWVIEIAAMLDPEIVRGGTRSPKDRFRDFTHPMITALQPFSIHGTLHHRVRSFGQGRLFDLETELGAARNGPVTVLITARQQDLDKSATILSLAIKRLQWLMFERMAQSRIADERPVLLLLDETRRIRDFDAAEYVSFAREAKATCVVAYQTLDQIGPPAKVVELLENVGTQIYLGSLVGNTARHFLSIMPTRSRVSVSRQESRGTNGTTQSTTTQITEAPYFTTGELSDLPAGRWPALVYINDQPRRKPILTSMDEAREGVPKAAPSPTSQRQDPPTPAVPNVVRAGQVPRWTR